MTHSFKPTAEQHAVVDAVPGGGDLKIKAYAVDGRLTLDEDEMRLLYVAVTRAQHVLDISELREELLRLFNSRR